MRLSGRTERQRRNLPCRASPAECCQERRESLSGPFHNFSIGRHLWFGPMRSRPQQRVVQTQTECSLNRSVTFACDFPRVVFLASGPTRCSLDATLKTARELLEVAENRGVYEESHRISGGG